MRFDRHPSPAEPAGNTPADQGGKGDEHDERRRWITGPAVSAKGSDLRFDGALTMVFRAFRARFQDKTNLLWRHAPFEHVLLEIERQIRPVKLKADAHHDRHNAAQQSTGHGYQSDELSWRHSRQQLEHDALLHFVILRRKVGGDQNTAYRLFGMSAELLSRVA
jgi:hypothetical protein